MIAESVEGISFAQERTDTVLKEIGPLMIEHDKIVATDINRDFPVDISEESYKKMEQAGILWAFTARDAEGKLVGYLTYFIFPSIHRKTLTVAHEDAFYVRPEARKRGVAKGLKAFAESKFAGKAQFVIYHAPVTSPVFGKMLEREGCEKYATYYGRKL